MSSVLLLPALVGIAIFLLHCLMEWVLHFYLFFVFSEVTEGLVTAAIIAVVLVQVQIIRRRRLLQYQRRLEAVARLNHHVRNALEVIMAHASGEIRVPAEHVERAIRRIDWILRDVEPQLKTQELEG